MVRRLPSQPPALAGFSYVHVLGSGGFADVFLYEQNMPRRQVAVKVMLREVVNDHVRRMFQAEANLMAQLSAHPAILTVYQASVSADGRPYIVMEMCSASLSQRYRSERIPVADVLRIAVRIGSAVETAHRAGVLHRDIKPSNILTTAYGHPVLSDFGIAATLGEAAGSETVGMSIPWSAPEVLADETPGTIASEVWSFAATVYSLLAGRSPFELPGGSNSSNDLIARINKAKPQPIGRPDVPPSLERLLDRAMSKRPSDRPASIIDLLHQLQAIENELGVPQTPVEVQMDSWAIASATPVGEQTVVRSLGGQSETVAQRRRRRRQAESSPVTVGTVLRDSVTGGRSGASETMQRPSPSRRLWVIAAAAVTIALAAVVTTVVLLLPNGSGVPVVSDITSSVQGSTVEFTWADPGLTATDAYRIVAGADAPVQQREPRFSVTGQPGDRLCVTVAVVRDGSIGPVSGETCAVIPQ